MIKGQSYMTVQGDEISVGIGVASDELSFVVKIPQQGNIVGSTTDLEGIGKHYDLGEVLGQGAFAIVKKAIERKSGTVYAVKIIRKNHLTKNVTVNKEVQILQQLNHENVAGLHDFYEDERNYYLVMDFLAGGDLMEFVLQNGAIPEDASREVVKQILKAVEYVHALGISHRDLKPDNILIARDNPVVVKVSDFGLAKMQQSGSFLKTFCGTLAYLAPEVLFSRDHKVDVKYSNLCDIWSIGCLAYVILTGYLPFEGATQDQMNKNIGTGRFQLTPLTDRNVSQSGIDFIAELLTVDPEKRPSASACLQLPWMLDGETTQSSDESFSNEMAVDKSVQIQSSYNEVLPMSSLQINSSRNELPQQEPQAEPPSPHSHSPHPLATPTPPAPALGDSDSDSDSQDIKKQAELELSQRSNIGSSMKIESSFDSGIQVRNGIASSPPHQVLAYHQRQPGGVRDFDSIDHTAERIPPGAYMRLDTLPHSIPFRDIYITQPVFTIGRNTSNDVHIQDLRISKRHCDIVRVPPPSGSTEKDQIWLVDRSTNGCYINDMLIGNGRKTLLESGDTICLFVDKNRNSRKGMFPSPHCLRRPGSARTRCSSLRSELLTE